jgi:hypothetical protein
MQETGKKKYRIGKATENLKQSKVPFFAYTYPACKKGPRPPPTQKIS